MFKNSNTYSDKSSVNHKGRRVRRPIKKHGSTSVTSHSSTIPENTSPFSHKRGCTLLMHQKNADTSSHEAKSCPPKILPSKFDVPKPTGQPIISQGPIGVSKIGTSPKTMRILEQNRQRIKEIEQQKSRSRYEVCIFGFRSYIEY